MLITTGLEPHVSPLQVPNLDAVSRFPHSVGSSSAVYVSVAELGLDVWVLQLRTPQDRVDTRKGVVQASMLLASEPRITARLERFSMYDGYLDERYEDHVRRVHNIPNDAVRFEIRFEAVAETRVSLEWWVIDVQDTQGKGL